MQPDSFAPLLKYLGAPNVAYPHTHASSKKNATRAVLQFEADRFSSYTRVVERVYDIYEMDYRALGYKRSKDDDAAFVMHIFEFLGEECF